MAFYRSCRRVVAAAEATPLAKRCKIVVFSFIPSKGAHTLQGQEEPHITARESIGAAGTWLRYDGCDDVII